MKTLKALIVCLLVFAGQKLVAQQIGVTNNTNLTNGTAVFIYSGCPSVTVPFSAGSIGSFPSGCNASFLVQVDITFDDPTCPSNPQPVITLTPTSPTFSYIDCSGVMILFSLNFLAPNDWDVSIN